MKRILLTFLFSIALTFSVQAKLKVVATLPDFAALAREIGDDKVDITTLAKADRRRALRRCAAKFCRWPA